MNIEEVARAVGYATRSSFAVAFRRKFGINPKSYLG
jgi:AraC-like DNA-binding protein